MLIRFKKSYEKIAMGLLSFMPTEKDLKKLQVTVKEYEENQNWQLYLWKENEDVLGIIGTVKKEDGIVHIQHICVTPSHRHAGIGTKMVQELRSMMPGVTVCGNEHTASFCEKCEADPIQL
ncbi:GNAT family N-acetyltransferase [Ectobacillus sp. JY-23]|uniref:GNAT family N-acetyltransferase n=1 Tax=Ectobacillus sp. JY-23 TaxID=2933872 RepID=UPI001FF26AA0|nr:GNAT family N-acetyltransferase [Ectobacillus sp. JY-23]UOY93852.1 GNAT family N-acetyltransferase [Ectobacillus sp. JY-23]